MNRSIGKTVGSEREMNGMWYQKEIGNEPKNFSIDEYRQ